MHGAITGVRSEIGSEISGLRGEIGSEIGGLRGEIAGLNARFDALEKRFDHLDRDVQGITDRMCRGERDA